MIRIVFQGVDPSYSVTAGPAPRFEFVGAVVRRGDTGAPVAAHRNYGWDVAEEHFTAFECDGPALIWFEDGSGQGSERIGPLKRFWAADGMLYAEDETIAKFDEATGAWQNQLDNSSWRTIVVAATT